MSLFRRRCVTGDSRDRIVLRADARIWGDYSSAPDLTFSRRRSPDELFAESRGSWIVWQPDDRQPAVGLCQTCFTSFTAPSMAALPDPLRCRCDDNAPLWASA